MLVPCAGSHKPERIRAQFHLEKLRRTSFFELNGETKCGMTFAPREVVPREVSRASTKWRTF